MSIYAVASIARNRHPASSKLTYLSVYDSFYLHVLAFAFYIPPRVAEPKHLLLVELGVRSIYALSFFLLIDCPQPNLTCAAHTKAETLRDVGASFPFIRDLCHACSLELEALGLALLVSTRSYRFDPGFHP